MRCCGSSPAAGSACAAGIWLGLLMAAQVYIGEELLADTAVAAVIIVAVLALGQPRAHWAPKRPCDAVTALGAAVAVAALACGYPLWVQFRGPLTEHGSPWTVSDFHNYLYDFVTPSGGRCSTPASSAAGGQLSRAVAGVPRLPGLAAADRAVVAAVALLAGPGSGSRR